MNFTFLKASVPLTKSFIKNTDGSISKSSYPMAYEVTTITEKCRDMVHFSQLLTKHASLGHCLLKGNPIRELVNESRAGNTDRNAQTEWICLDVDGLDCKDAEEFLSITGLHNVTHVTQYSASYKLSSTDLRCHIYMLIHYAAAPIIKQWLVQVNHTIARLRDAMTLTKTGNAISWVLDITTCQNDKLIYIAPPLLKGLKDPLKGSRITYHAGTTDRLMLPLINTVAQNKTLTSKRIMELRAASGYEPRKQTFKMVSGHEVMIKPDGCLVTDVKIERGFVYLNINSGDSWGYYHPENNPDIIHNFKGEPSYQTKELLPEYWRQLTETATTVRSDGTTYIAFCDRKTGAYWKGTHDQITDALDIHVAKNALQLRDFAKQHGMPLGDFIPEGDLVFDPHDNVRVDPDNRVVNLFEPSAYMRTEIIRPVTTCPKAIYKVIHHALGSDDEITRVFLNWVAYILQFRDRTCTAWVLHGTTGTGKGALMNRILRPLFGMKQTIIKRMEELNEPYNAFMEQALIVFVDEVETKALMNEKGAMAKLKNFITEETISIRQLYVGAKEANNYTNWIFASNKADAVSIDKNDRRFNVAKYQPIKIIITPKEIEQIEQELQQFHDFLINMTVDIEQAHTPFATLDRDNMMSISESSVDTVGSALLEGRFEFFTDQLPSGTAYERNAMKAAKVTDYKEVLTDLINRTSIKTGVCNITREEMHTLFEFTVGKMPDTPNKFTSLLKHHRIHTTRIRIGETLAQGMRLTWTDAARFAEYANLITPPQPAPAKLKAVK